MKEITIFGDLNSGNCQKIKWTAEFLDICYKWVDVDITKGESRTPEFLKLNPMGQVPVVRLADGRMLAQSNAIIQYLTEGSPLYPPDAYARSRINALMFWEQYSHEPYLAVCRYQMVYLGKLQEEREPWRVQRGEAALDFMESLLKQQTWFLDPDITIADICLLPYTRLCEEGGFSLAKCHEIKEWISRTEAYLGIERIPV